MALKDNYITITEAAKQLGVTRQTISRWISKGYVPGEKIGRETLIKKKDLYKYHNWRLSEAAADSVIALINAKLDEYLRKEGYINADERFMGVEESKYQGLLVKKTDGTVRSIELSHEELDKAFSFCREPLAELLFYLGKGVVKKNRIENEQEVNNKGRRTTK
jgi:excisionase family DNA binding protein